VEIEGEKEKKTFPKKYILVKEREREFVMDKNPL